MWTRAERFLLTARRPLYGASGAGSSPTSWRALDTPPPGAFLGPQPPIWVSGIYEMESVSPELSLISFVKSQT